MTTAVGSTFSPEQTNSVSDHEVWGPSPQNNFLCGAPGRLINEIFADGSTINRVWQPDVYACARSVAEQLGINRIIDFGCGAGSKLISYFAPYGFSVTGIDFQASLEVARAGYPSGDWRECDLTDRNSLRATIVGLDIKEPVLCILSDVIEHLTDPRPVVSELRNVLLAEPRNRLIVSTPDRAKTAFKGVLGAPHNTAHQREWSLQELDSFFRNSGFRIVTSENTRSHHLSYHRSTSLVVLAADHDEYINHLRSIGLAQGTSMPGLVIVTSEYHGLIQSGGIGTYVEQQRNLVGRENVIVLVVGKVNEAAAAAHGVLTPERVLGIETAKLMPPEDQALAALEQFLFFLPQLTSIHYQEYRGIGCRIAQAKAAGLLPDDLKTVVHCHGGTIYLENAEQRWFGHSYHTIPEKEKIAIERSDVVVFLSRFLHRLYHDAGFRIADDRVEFLPTPFAFISQGIEQYRKVDTVIFAGKRYRMKGFELFIETMLQHASEWVDLGIKRVIILARSASISAKTQKQLDALKQHFTVEDHGDFDRHQMKECIERNAARSAVLLPYQADNFPLIVFEALAAGVAPIVANRGGMPEMIPQSLQSASLVMEGYSADALATALRRFVHLAAPDRAKVRDDILDYLQAEKERVTKELSRIEQRGITRSRSSLTVDVAIPFYNTDAQHIRELVHGLNCQTRKPSNVIFVNDASRDEYVSDLESVVREDARFPYTIISHNTNLGLAGARNTALQATSADVLINLDSDDVPLPDFVRDIAQGFELCDRVIVCLPYLSAFTDGEEYNRFPMPYRFQYRPVGEGMIAGQIENLLGHANAGVRVAAARELSGWNQSSRAKWEDWEFYLKVLSSGGLINVIPKFGVLYRVRRDSMSRTYDQWPAMLRLAGSPLSLPRYEVLRLQSYLRSYQEAKDEPWKAPQDQRRAERELRKAQHQAKTWRRQANRLRRRWKAERARMPTRVVNKVVARLRHYPRVLSSTRWLVRAAWKAETSMRRFVGSRSKHRS